METSAVWKYFVRDTRDTASCRICQKELRCKGSSTTGLRRHLKSIHKFVKRDASLNEDDDLDKPIVVEEINPMASLLKDDLEAPCSPEYLDYEVIDAPNATSETKQSKRNVMLELLDLHKERKDEDSLFFDSFMPTIRSLPLQEKMQFKMEFQQLLYKYIFKDVEQIA